MPSSSSGSAVSSQLKRSVAQRYTDERKQPPAVISRELHIPVHSVNGVLQQVRRVAKEQSLGLAAGSGDRVADALGWQHESEEAGSSVARRNGQLAKSVAQGRLRPKRHHDQSISDENTGAVTHRQDGVAGKAKRRNTGQDKQPMVQSSDQSAGEASHPARRGPLRPRLVNTHTHRHHEQF